MPVSTTPTTIVLLPVEMSQAMGNRFPEALTAVAFLAGATTRIKVLTNVLVLPYRHPVLLAKGVSTLDYLSGGRVILGIGVGHLQREFDILGVPFSERGPMTDEYIQAMRELWTSERPRFQGRYVQFEDVLFEPKPLQKPHPPLWIGSQGKSRPSMRRAGNLGDGWIPNLVPPEALVECLEYIRQQPGFRERPRPFDVIVPLERLQIEAFTHRPLGATQHFTSKDEAIEEIGRLKDVGATGVRTTLGQASSLEQFLERMHWFSEEVMPVFRC